MTLARLIFAPIILFAVVSGAQAKAETLTLRITSDDGEIRFYHHGKRLSEATLHRLCATARSQKVEIEFQREKMTGKDALASILKEADCLDARGGSKRIEPEPKSAPHTHARRRHRGAEPL